MVCLRKIEIAFLENHSVPNSFRESRELLFICFAIFSYGSCWPSWTVQSHQFEGTSFAVHSD